MELNFYFDTITKEKLVLNCKTRTIGLQALKTLVLKVEVST
jgi:hypothetical protein